MKTGNTLHERTPFDEELIFVNSLYFSNIIYRDNAPTISIRYCDFFHYFSKVLLMLVYCKFASLCLVRFHYRFYYIFHYLFSIPHYRFIFLSVVMSTCLHNVIVFSSSHCSFNIIDTRTSVFVHFAHISFYIWTFVSFVPKLYN